MKNIYNSLLPKIALFSASLIWGTSFIVMKNAVGVFPTHILIALRFTFGCILLSLIFMKKLKKLNYQYILSGGIIGIFLFLAYSMQTIGLNYTTPGKNAFLTAVYCVIVPFMYWIVDKTKPDKYNISAAIVCIIGVGLVSLNGDLSMGIGDIFTLLGGLGFAFQITAISKLTKDRDPILLTIIQFATTAVLAWIVGLSFETMPKNVAPDAIFELGYLIIFATCICIVFQNVGQKYTNPSAAAILLSLESVFGVFFSVIMGHEILTLQLTCGFVLIFVAVVISETKLSFIKKKTYD